eukprot:TRINITY_DN41948_c0_g1_i1.p1 TRINITY_DN41948_c0_g1~~TRINITY_DN41948_c0_g1_i1.p1  ORF type:complete len:357 (-),score=43.39 TRINITY_DN41948_c0_g1_i1:101-1171(-)
MSGDESQLLESWKIPCDYDWRQETFENYGAEGRRMLGPFAEIRRRLDFDHHGCYMAKRQQLQDAIIRQVLGVGARNSHPWIIFTAGSFFAGKSSVVSWMMEEGHLPLLDLVRTDPDLIRLQLPEWKGYLQRDSAEAAVRTHREAGTCALIAQWEALRCGRNVLVDGSLQNAPRQKAFFAEIRAAYPNYRIAILRVFASWDATEQRSHIPREGGRTTSPKALRGSFDAVKRSVAELETLADLVLHIENNTPPPKLDSATCGDQRISSWTEVGSAFLKPPRPKAGRRRRNLAVASLLFTAALLLLGAWPGRSIPHGGRSPGEMEMLMQDTGMQSGQPQSLSESPGPCTTKIVYTKKYR